MKKKLKRKLSKKRTQKRSFWKRHRTKLISAFIALFAASAIAVIFLQHHSQSEQRSFVPTQRSIETKPA